MIAACVFKGNFFVIHGMKVFSVILSRVSPDIIISLFSIDSSCHHATK
jgi:hypothetical protein